jgi:hypothetical protein
MAIAFTSQNGPDDEDLKLVFVRLLLIIEQSNAPPMNEEDVEDFYMSERTISRPLSSE